MLAYHAAVYWRGDGGRVHVLQLTSRMPAAHSYARDIGRSLRDAGGEVTIMYWRDARRGGVSKPVVDGVESWIDMINDDMPF